MELKATGEPGLGERLLREPLLIPRAMGLWLIARGEAQVAAPLLERHLGDNARIIAVPYG